MPIALHRQVNNSRLVLHKNALESSAVWPDVGEKGSPIFSKSCPIRSQCSFYIRVRFFKIATKSCQSFGLLLLDILLPRTFKNRPIWSHWLSLTINRALWDRQLVKYFLVTSTKIYGKECLPCMYLIMDS